MRALKKYASKRFYRLKHLLASVTYTDDLEILHAIRVEIKKIKAILTLLEFSKKNFKAHKHFIPIRNLFRKAGVIREPVVLHNLLIRYMLNGTTDDLLLFPSIKPISGFRKNVPNFLKAVKKTKKIIHLKIEKINKADVEHYLKKLKKKLEKRLYPNPDPLTLHRTRKLLKEFLYLSASWKIKQDSIPPFFEECAVRIGQWHDKQRIIQILTQRGLPMEEPIRKLKSACLQDLEHLRLQAQRYYSIQTTMAVQG